MLVRAGNDTRKAQVTPGVYPQHLLLRLIGRKAGLPADLQPLEPVPPSIRDHIGAHYVHQARFRPMIAPPVGTVKAPKIPWPIRSEMFGKADGEFLSKAGNHDTDLSTGTNEPCVIPHVEIVSPKIVVRI